MNALTFPPPATPRRIAVIGAGITGLGAAWALSRRHDVTLFEKDARAGGHANTVDVDYDGQQIAVDTGFIVYNEVNYPNLCALFDALGVATQPSDMSFGVSFSGGGLEWAGDSVSTLFAQWRNLFSVRHHAMWTEILRFNRTASTDLEVGALAGLTLGAYLASRGFGAAFRDRYLLPMGAAIWSMPNADMLGFPAASFLAFFRNHGLLSGFDTFQWRTVSGGSREYVRKLIADIHGDIRLGCGVTSVRAAGNGVDVADQTGATTRFDHVVLACHPQQALALLADATPAERSILSGLRHAPNVAVLHRDPALMPQRRKVWSSWNYISDAAPGLTTAPVSLTYWMNRLQGIDRSKPLFVTLNPAQPPRPDLTFGTFHYAHPQFDAAAERTRAALGSVQGARGLWFCGAWCGHGFHEDGLTAGLEVAAALGAPAPWRAVGQARALAA